MSDPSKSREMKERWRDPVYREQGLQALHKANERYVNKPRSVAESIYRMSRTKAKTQRESPQQSQPRQKSPND